jgi:cation diffusion facilitator CzcD-associated flavoprotein CzcO
MSARQKNGTPAKMNDSLLSVSEVIIIGTGFSGLGMGAALVRNGNHSFVMLERASSLGGTWRDNTYPGAACDIQSHLYSYSFRPNPNWSSVYAPQAEILEYLQKTAEDEGLLPHIFFDSEVSAAQWDEESSRWRVHTSNGMHVAKSLISASGHLSEPSMPAIPGLETFKGRVFHSARWDHSCDWSGKRVGVVGTGASAIQIVPEMAKTAEHVTVFQRTAPYVIPRKDRIYEEYEKGMFERLPETAQALRDELFWGNESRFPQRRGAPAFLEQITKIANDHLEAQVDDPELRERLRPGYEIGCKRVLISNDYYTTLCQPNVELETSAIASVNEWGVEMLEGKCVELDILVVATGFEATDLPIAHRIEGRAGTLLSDHWSGGGQAFACTTVSGFPNLFVMLGPNTGLGAGSIIFMVETQASYISEALDFIRGEEAVIEPEALAQDEYVASIDRRAQGSVWLEGGCKSWYLHPDTGRLTTLWPDFMTQFRVENGSFNPHGYVVKSLSGTEGEVDTWPTLSDSVVSSRYVAD